MYLSLSDWTSRNSETGRNKATRIAYKASPTVIALGIVSMLTDISSESVAAVLPVYITGALGLSMVAYGFLDGLNQGVSALVRISAGYAADRSNRPKHVAFAGYGLSMIARIGLLFASGFLAISAVIGLDRVGKGIRTAPRDAMIQEASQPEHLARSFGLHRMLDTIGATIGPLIAFIILWMIPDGYRLLFVISLCAAIIGVATLGLVVPNVKLGAAPTMEKPVQTEDDQLSRQPKFKELARGPLRNLLGAAALLSLLTVGDGFIYLSLMEHGHLATSWFPLFFVGTNAVFLLFAIPVGRVADRTSKAGVFVLGHLALGGAYLFSVAGGSFMALVAALVLLGLFYASTDGVLAALAGQLSPPEFRSTGIASAQTVVAVCRMIASSLFGVLWVVFGASTLMICTTVVLFVAIPAAWFLLVARTSIQNSQG